MNWTARVKVFVASISSVLISPSQARAQSVSSILKAIGEGLLPPAREHMRNPRYGMPRRLPRKPVPKECMRNPVYGTPHRPGRIDAADR